MNWVQKLKAKDNLIITIAVVTFFVIPYCIMVYFYFDGHQMFKFDFWLLLRGLFFCLFFWLVLIYGSVWVIIFIVGFIQGIGFKKAAPYISTVVSVLVLYFGFNYLNLKNVFYEKPKKYTYVLPDYNHANTNSNRTNPYVPPKINWPKIKKDHKNTNVYRVGAICWDGSRSYSTGRGTCSHHGGVKYWLLSDGSKE